MAAGESVMVPFDRKDGATSQLPIEWVSGMLTLFYRIRPELFGALLAVAVTGVIPKMPRAVNGQ